MMRLQECFDAKLNEREQWPNRQRLTNTTRVGRNGSEFFRQPPRRDFTERFERGKLSFTGDVLQVISVFGRQQKFAKLLKRLVVGA
jgi:hypothetical protein